MAVNEIQAGEFNSLLHKRLQMKEGAPAPILGTEIVAGFTLESDRPEWAFLKGERLLSLVGVAPLTAQQGGVYLFNPAGSGVLVIVSEGIGMVSAGAKFQTAWGVTRTAPVASLGPAPRDLRTDAALGALLGVAFGGVTTTATGTFTIQQDDTDFSVSPPLLSHLEVPVILAPGSGLGFIPVGAQTASVFATFHYLERPLPGEETR